LPEIIKEGNTVLTGETPFDYKEAFKVLRTKIQFSGIDKPMKKIAITSSGPFEGKTTVSINTALTLAETGKSVLLIDCDLRKPKVSKTLGLEQEPGLSNVLTNDAELEFAIRKIDKFDTLDIIPCGVIPPNPAELLGSEQMGKFLTEIDDVYDYIIFDTPPIGLVADTAELSRFIDGVIWVVSYGRTIKESAIFAKETLDSVDAHLIGCVFNGVKADGYGTRSYYRRYGYGYGGKYGYKYGYGGYYGYGYGEAGKEQEGKRGFFGAFGGGKGDRDDKH
jgi:capsular exopolysaccharide synthesis family protein